MKNKDKNVTIKKKKRQMRKIQSLEKSLRSASKEYQNTVDCDEEHIYRLDNQEFKNLHKLDNYKVLLSQGDDKSTKDNTKGSQYSRSYSQAFRSQASSLTGSQGREFYKENFSTINLDRPVRIKQYAPAAFRRIRDLSGIGDDLMLDSLDPSVNVK